MLYFVIPFKSRRVAKDWARACDLLQSTLRSVCSQTCHQFRVLVVCHEKPTFDVDPSIVRFVESPFEPPCLEGDVNITPWERFQRLSGDKGRKLLWGLGVAREEAAKFTMFVDADDLVSRRICEFVHASNHPYGWVVVNGYRMDESSSWVAFRRKRFNHECGTSHILRTTCAPFPENIETALADGGYFVERYDVHAYIADDMGKRGTPLGAIPFYGAIYRFNSEAMYSGSFRRKDGVAQILARYALKGRVVTKWFRREFGFER